VQQKYGCVWYNEVELMYCSVMDFVHVRYAVLNAYWITQSPLAALRTSPRWGE
jgi:hypothetical protein